MKVVVLGASGNAGVALLRALDAEPAVDAVVAVARRPPTDWPSGKIVWRPLDIVSGALDPLIRGAGAVVHLAWLIHPGRDVARCRAVNVDGTRRVLDSVAATGVRTFVFASSVGAYSPGPKNRTVEEAWPTHGIPSSFYSRHKAEVERLLDAFERERPQTRVVRLRPGLIFQRGAASEIRRLFAGPFVPGRLADPRLIPVVPRHPRLRFQAVHADDVADAYRRAIVGDAHGAFNIAAEPVLDGDSLGRVLGARPVPTRAGVLRRAAAAAFAVRLSPTPPGWIDLALGVPLMNTARARTELGWAPRRDAAETLMELLAGIRDGAGDATPTLRPGGDGALRWREIARGVGARDM